MLQVEELPPIHSVLCRPLDFGPPSMRVLDDIAPWGGIPLLMKVSLYQPTLLLYSHATIYAKIGLRKDLSWCVNGRSYVRVSMLLVTGAMFEKETLASVVLFEQILVI